MLSIVIFMVISSVLFILRSCWRSYRKMDRWSGVCGDTGVVLDRRGEEETEPQNCLHFQPSPVVMSSGQWPKRQSLGYKLPKWDSSGERQGFTLETRSRGAPRAAAACWRRLERLIRTHLGRDVPGTGLDPPGWSGTPCWPCCHHDLISAEQKKIDALMNFPPNSNHRRRLLYLTILFKALFLIWTRFGLSNTGRQLMSIKYGHLIFLSRYHTAKKKSQATSNFPESGRNLLRNTFFF